MSRTNLSIPVLGNKFVDLRDSIPGDSFNWSWERALSQVNYLAIHETSTTDGTTPQEIAQNHISKNGWAGIGYHFLVDREGTVFYVGDISTARANVANLNEQVLGIGLIGSFTQGKVPTNQQLESAHILCDFFIKLPDLENVNSWDKLRGHKELPGQVTNCPGDDWEDWRIKIVEGLPTGQADVSTTVVVDPNQYKAAVEEARKVPILVSQINGLQTSLASLNQQVISLRETLQQREEEINRLKSQPPPIVVNPQPAPQPSTQPDPDLIGADNTLTLVGALIKLYGFLFPARKAEQ